MPLHFRCPCGTVLAADDGSAEKGGQCPSCGKVVIVPEGAAAITSEELGPVAPAPEAPAAGGTERIDRPVQAQGGGAAGDGPEVAAPPQETPAEPAPAEASQPAAAPPEEPPAVPGPAFADFEAPAAGEAAGAPAVGACPECGSPLDPGAVLCVQCGLNLQTGEKVSAAAAPAPAAAEADFAEPPEVPAELPADGLEPVSGEVGPVEEPDGLKAAAIQALAELDDIGEIAPARGKRGRARPVEKKKGGLAGKLIIVFLILLLLAAGAFVAVVFFAPHLLPDQVRALLKSYGIIKAGKVP
ncbi:MAG: hypothetical protein ACYSU0_06020 [Planctomycetota bacterium]